MPGWHLGAALLEEPPRGSHVVQFYDDQRFLFETVGRYLAAGMRAGDRLLAIATRDHIEGICNALGTELSNGLIRSGQLTFVDANELLTEFMRGDTPDPALFRKITTRIFASTRRHAGARLRAFGEMVDLLWREGRMRAAVQLEELWNESGREQEFSLLCAYTMGHLQRGGDSAGFLDVCGCHSHVLPTESFSRVETLDSVLRQISLLEQRSRLLESEVDSRKEIEHTLRDALEQRDAFKEVFINVLGHDLRNPLSTILATTRLMALRGELGPDTTKRLARVINSGVRLQRMVEQILDMTRYQLARGISVNREPCNLAPLVTKVAEIVHLAHPSQSLELQVQHCWASVDADRFEQVVTTLIDNAATHGDPDQPIIVRLAERGSAATFSVHNRGPAIDEASLLLLFDPFRRARKPVGRSAGLGLGLYISARIVEAHAGKIHVESSADAGTLFEVSFPRDV